MTKIVLAFDSFKGCMSADEACHAAALAIHEAMPDAEVVECALSDGGEGLVECVEQSIPTKRITIKAHDPLMNIIDASYLIDEATGTAYIEMATTSGLTLVPPDRRNPMQTTTYGVGDMIIDAIRHSCRKIVMGIGGSATCDAGMGMLQCLRDNSFCKQALTDCKITVASDVTNPLYGENGAACVFAPQKGATPEQVLLLDKRLRDFARKTTEAGVAPGVSPSQPGAGAAGGLGFALMAYLNAELKCGVDVVLDMRNFDSLIENATVIITGEGKSDGQTLMGKVPCGVLRRAQKIPVWLISGCVEDKEGTLSRKFSRVKSINNGDSRTIDVLMQPRVAKENLRKTIKESLEGLIAGCPREFQLN